MVERERWEGRFRAAKNRWEATIAVAIAMGGNAKLAGDRYKALHRGQGEGGGKGMHRGGHDLVRKLDGLAAKGSLLRNNTTEIAGKLARE